MHEPTGDNYLTPYVHAEQAHGSDFRVTLWANERSQQLRFRVMTEMVFMTGKRVLDAGCSRGDFAAYLIEKGFAYERFVGVDGVEPVVAYASQRGLPRSRFIAGDFVADPSLMAAEDPQVVALSGTLNTMSDEMALTVLENAWSAAREALIFNFLSDRTGERAPKQKPPARRLPTMRLLDWALGQTSAVHFRQDYFKFGHDATVVMRKN